MKVKIVLKDTVEGLGMVGDVVDVAPGYARNYIIPNKLGLEVTAGTMQAIEAAKKKRELIDAERKLSLTEKATKITELGVITIAEKVSDSGSLYGSVTAGSVVSKLAEQNIEIAENAVCMQQQSIKSVGEYVISFNLHVDIENPECKLIVEALAENEGDDRKEEDDDYNDGYSADIEED